MPEEDQRALARQCAAWLEEWPIVTVALLAEGHPGMDARCLRRVFERHAPGRIDVREELCIRPGRPMYESEEQMARSVVEELRRSGGAQAIAKLTARFPNVDAEWLSIRFPELCGKLGVACVTEGNAVLIPPDEVPGDVAGALGEDPAERHFADVATAVAESCGERSPEAFLNVYFQDSAALFRRFVELKDPHERTWRGDMLGASNLSLSELAAKLPQPFAFEDFCAAGRRLCGWTRDGNLTALAQACLRLDEDLWMTPAAFREAVGWDDGLATRIAARLRMFLGAEPYFVLARISQGQLDLLPPLRGDFPWTPELAESVAAHLIPGLRLLDHAQSTALLTGFLVPDSVPAGTDPIRYLTHVYRAHNPNGATIEGALDFIVDGVRVRMMRTEALRKRVAAEIRPVYAEEMTALGFDRHFVFDAAERRPLCWARQTVYLAQGREIARLAEAAYGKPIRVAFVAPKGMALRPVDIGAMAADPRNMRQMDALVASTQRRLKAIYDAYAARCDLAYIAFSGGKDSAALLDLCHRTLPFTVPVVFAETGMDLPGTDAVWEEARQRYPERTFIRAQATHEAIADWELFGPPSQKLRWCCTVRKSAPTISCLRRFVGKSDVRFLAFVSARRPDWATR